MAARGEFKEVGGEADVAGGEPNVSGEGGVYIAHTALVIE